MLYSYLTNHKLCWMTGAEYYFLTHGFSLINRKTEFVRAETDVPISRRPEEDHSPVSGVLSRFVGTSHERPREWRSSWSRKVEIPNIETTAYSLNVNENCDVIVLLVVCWSNIGCDQRCELLVEALCFASANGAKFVISTSPTAGGRAYSLFGGTRTDVCRSAVAVAPDLPLEKLAGQEPTSEV